MLKVTSEVTANDFQIKGLKTTGGEGASRFEVSLYFAGKRVATVSNEGNGSCHRWSWIDKEAEKCFDRILETLAVEFEKGDRFINRLIDKQVETTSFKSKCKKKTLFLLADEEAKDGCRSINAAFSPEVKIHLVNKYGAQLGEIINERFLP